MTSPLSSAASLQTSVYSAAIRPRLNLFQSAGSAAAANAPGSPSEEALQIRGGGFVPRSEAPSSSKAPLVIGAIAVALAGGAAFLLLRKRKKRARR